MFCFAPDTPQEVVEAYERSRWGPGQLQLAGRWSRTAIDGGGLSQGDPTTLTYSFVPDGTTIFGQSGASRQSDLFATFDAAFPATAEWQARFHEVFDRWEELTGLSYVHEPNDDGEDLLSAPGEEGVRGDIRIGGMFIDGPSNVLAFNTFPDNGDMVLDTGDIELFANMAGDGLLLRNVLAHEHGHGLGILHVCPVNETKLMEPLLSTAFDGPQHDDILSAQRHYGDAYEHNDSVGSATGLGSLTDSPRAIADVSIDGPLDADVYSFAVDGEETVSVSMLPVGMLYREGPQRIFCTFGRLFNSRAVSDLGVELLATDGATILAAADHFGTGRGESLVNVELPGAGTYFVRVHTSGGVEKAQLYDLELSAADLEVRLAVNGLHPSDRIVETDGPVALTLDMAPSVVKTPLSWFFGVSAGGLPVWFSLVGPTPIPVPLVAAPPLALDGLPLLNVELPPGSEVSFLFALADASGVVAGDMISAVVR